MSKLRLEDVQVKETDEYYMFILSDPDTGKKFWQRINKPISELELEMKRSDFWYHALELKEREKHE